MRSSLLIKFSNLDKAYRSTISSLHLNRLKLPGDARLAPHELNDSNPAVSQAKAYNRRLCFSNLLRQAESRTSSIKLVVIEHLIGTIIVDPKLAILAGNDGIEKASARDGCNDELVDFEVKSSVIPFDD